MGKAVLQLLGCNCQIIANNSNFFVIKIHFVQKNLYKLKLAVRKESKTVLQLFINNFCNVSKLASLSEIYNILILVLQDSSTTSSPIFTVKNSFDQNKLEVSLSCE